MFVCLFVCLLFVCFPIGGGALELCMQQSLLSLAHMRELALIHLVVITIGISPV